MVVMAEMDIELNALDGSFVVAGNMEMIVFQSEFFQFILQPVRIDTQIDQCADEHVAADAAEYVQI